MTKKITFVYKKMRLSKMDQEQQEVIDMLKKQQECCNFENRVYMIEK
ncbi:hypothetical protein [Nostoc phage A1]|nr:hypothetical protein [Nostoc phage A1]